MKIAVCGEIRSGKDSFCEYIMSKNADMGKLYFAEGIKQVIQTCFPDELEKGKPRRLYQDIGTYMRSINPDVWVNHLEREYLWHRQYMNDFIVSDLRQQNEYKWLKENGFTVVKVEAAFEIRKERALKAGDVFDEETFNHPVEQQIRTLSYDYLVTNNDTLEELFKQADYILNELKGEEGKWKS